MVKKLTKIFAYFLFFLFALALFMPKESFYFLLEENLKKFDVIISNEELSSDIDSLSIENLEVTTKGIESAVVNKADIKLLFLYNSLVLEGIELSSLVEVYIPSKIAELSVSYTLLNPLFIELSGVGEFGEFEGGFNLQSRALELQMQPSKKMMRKYKKTMRLLKKSENGEYVYAKTF